MIYETLEREMYFIYQLNFLLQKIAYLSYIVLHSNWTCKIIVTRSQVHVKSTPNAEYPTRV